MTDAEVWKAVEAYDKELSAWQLRRVDGPRETWLTVDDYRNLSELNGTTVDLTAAFISKYHDSKSDARLYVHWMAMQAALKSVMA
jgi:hypothetical protein